MKNNKNEQPDMYRRYFLLSLTSVFIAKISFAEGVLKGASAKASGERSRIVWEHANMLKGLRLAKSDEQLQIIIFFDPNCPSCQKLWQWYSAHSPNLACLWVPVAYVNKTSFSKAISLLGSTNPKAALQENYQSFDFSKNEGGSPEVQSITEVEKTTIRKNNRFWSKILFGTTPLILYRKNDGTYWQELGFSKSRLEEILSIIASS